ETAGRDAETAWPIDSTPAAGRPTGGARVCGALLDAGHACDRKRVRRARERSPARRNRRLNSTADPRLSGRAAVPTFTGYSMLLLLLALPFVAALAIAMARGASRRTVACLAAAAPLLGLAALGWLTPAVMDDVSLRA